MGVVNGQNNVDWVHIRTIQGHSQTCPPSSSVLSSLVRRFIVVLEGESSAWSEGLSRSQGSYMDRWVLEQINKLNKQGDGERKEKVPRATLQVSNEFKKKI